MKIFNVNLKQRRNRGYSLIELGVVLGVVSGLIVGVLFLAQTVTQQNKISQANQLLARAVATTLKMVALDGDTQNVDYGAVLKVSGEFSAGAFDGDDIKTGLGNAKIAIDGNGNGKTGTDAGPGTKFTVTIDELSKAQCLSLAQNLLLSRDAIDVFKVGKPGSETEYTHGGTNKLEELKSSGLTGSKGCVEATDNDIIARFK